MVAYLALTNEKWVVALKALRGSDSINFWSPSPRPLLKEIVGVILYFYATDGGDPRKYIRGRGKVKSFLVGTVREAWECYGNKNGAVNLRIFLKLLNDGQSTTEPRFLIVGQIAQTMWTATVTYRHEETIRLISVRRTRDSEKAQYLHAQAQRH